MTRRYARRQFLQSAAAAGLGATAGCTSLLSSDSRRNDANPPASPAHRDGRGQPPETSEPTDPIEAAAANYDPVDVRGALYVPARAWNTFQMWHDYDPAVIERDLGYADSVEVNAIRTWVSFEQYERDSAALERAVDHFLATADDYGIEVLFGLFESVGQEPTEENLHDTDPLTAPPCQSPSSIVMQNEYLWDDPREYVRWFMERYGDDDRLLAIEVMNEPGWLPDMEHFAAGMFETMAEHRGSVPLTVGSTSLANNAEYVDWGSDVLQFHYNFPNTREKYHDLLPQATQLGRDLDAPVYLSEWQKTADFGWDSSAAVENWEPDYASIAPVIHRHGVDNFFWSLMVKPAYVRYMRKRGIINGLFHEDGAVWNVDDARAIKAMSGDSEVDLDERREWPDWAKKVERHARGE
ncbi:glycoside hydrolase 5 family protein [Halorussus litoreus]|uniref:glycoside hydrolase n=1 Tax=Halorussus litoreus TaxID=1710536 RepID=UPI001E35BE02|nr:glycoside hydrolase [Halorussus litoreus]